MKKTAVAEEGDIVPFNWTGQVQILKNLQRTRTDEDYADISNSNDSSMMLKRQEPKLKAWIQGAIHYKGSI